jgi:pimeloyl-ACP methyl ester carboxylesterase
MKSGYAAVNGHDLYYEIHGSGRPLVLLHGALANIDTSFGAAIPQLAATRQVIAVDMQAHGHTADIDRPIAEAALATDVTGLLDQLGITSADVYGYSMGSGVAFEIALQRPDLIRKLMLAAFTLRRDGLYSQALEGIGHLTPEILAGTPLEQEFLRKAPRPDQWPRILEKINEWDRTFQGWPEEAVASVTAPTLVLIGDSDLVRPEHAVELFRLFGGGQPGDFVGLPAPNSPCFQEPRI